LYQIAVLAELKKGYMRLRIDLDRLVDAEGTRKRR